LGLGESQSERNSSPTDCIVSPACLDVNVLSRHNIVSGHDGRDLILKLVRSLK